MPLFISFFGDGAAADYKNRGAFLPLPVAPASSVNCEFCIFLYVVFIVLE
jgi:hypothetical protein